LLSPFFFFYYNKHYFWIAMLKCAFLSYEPAKPYMQLCYCAWPWKPYGPKTFKFCFFELFAFACLSTGRPEGFIEHSFVVTGLSVVVSAEKVSKMNYSSATIYCHCPQFWGFFNLNVIRHYISEKHFRIISLLVCLLLIFFQICKVVHDNRTKLSSIQNQ
jgi:hypothetical protein